MILQTKVPLQKEAKNPISYASKIVLLGSCFSENIGDKFAYFKFDTLTNPYGILFHPLAIEKALTEITEQKQYLQKDLFFHNERWHSFQHHSDFSAPTAAEVLTKINREIEISKQFFKSNLLGLRRWQCFYELILLFQIPQLNFLVY